MTRKQRRERADAIASPGGFYLWGEDKQRDEVRRQALRDWHQTDDDEYMYAAGIWARPEK